MKKKKILFNIAFIIFGGILGFLYWKFIGCEKGTCPITSKWANTTAYGSLIGYLLGSSVFESFEKKKQNNNQPTEVTE